MKTNTPLLKLLALVLALAMAGCSDCEECFTPPSPFAFEVVDAQTGENLFINGTYDPTKLEVRSTVDPQYVEHQYYEEEGIFLIGTIGWETEEVDLSIKVDGVEIFTFSTSAEVITKGCCTFTEFSNTSFGGATFEQRDQTGVYRVSIN